MTSMALRRDLRCPTGFPVFTRAGESIHYHGSACCGGRTQCHEPLEAA